MNEAPQLTSTLLVIAFAAVIITLGEWHVQSRSAIFSIVPAARANILQPHRFSRYNKPFLLRTEARTNVEKVRSN